MSATLQWLGDTHIYSPGPGEKNKSNCSMTGKLVSCSLDFPGAKGNPLWSFPHTFLRRTAHFIILPLNSQWFVKVSQCIMYGLLGQPVTRSHKQRCGITVSASLGAFLTAEGEMNHKDVDRLNWKAKNRTTALHSLKICHHSQNSLALCDAVFSKNRAMKKKKKSIHDIWQLSWMSGLNPPL